MSWKRFENQNDGIDYLIPAEYLDGRRLTVTGYARALSDYLDVVDEFVQNLPSQSDEQKLFFGAAFNARYKVNAFTAVPMVPPKTTSMGYLVAKTYSTPSTSRKLWMG